MRYPNLRYGNPTEMAYYAMGMPLADLARMLRRDERTVRDWLSARARVPWWVPEIMRLKRMEQTDMVYQMTGQRMLARLGRVETAELVDFGQHFRKAEPLPVATEPADLAPMLLLRYG